MPKKILVAGKKKNRALPNGASQPKRPVTTVSCYCLGDPILWRANEHTRPRALGGTIEPLKPPPFLERGNVNGRNSGGEEKIVVATTWGQMRVGKNMGGKKKRRDRLESQHSGPVRRPEEAKGSERKTDGGAMASSLSLSSVRSSLKGGRGSS